RLRTALKRAHRVIESGPSIVEIAIEIQPPEDLYLRLTAEPFVPKPLTDPRFTAPTLIDSKESLTGEVQANTDHRESFVAVLNLIAAVLVPREQVHSFQRRLVRVFCIEIQLSVSPTGGKSGAVIEGSVHLKVISVMLDLCSKCVFPIAEEVVNLLRRSASLSRGTHACLRLQERRGELVPLVEADGQIASRNAIVSPGVLRIGEDGANVIRFTGAVSPAGNVERFVPPGNRFTTISDILRTGIRGIQDPESKPALSTCEFCPPRWVDDFARVNGGNHVSITAASSEVEEAHSFHEKRPLFRVKDRKTLVDLHLECIALDLAEVWIDRCVQRDGRRDAIFGAQSKVGFSRRIIPAIWSRAKLVNGVRDARKQFKNPRLLQIRKDEKRVTVEYPQAGRNIRPCP